MKKHRKSILVGLFVLLCFGSLLPWATEGKDGFAEIKIFSPHNNLTFPSVSTIRVATLNLAHGRKNGSHQAFQSKEKIVQNLKEVTDFFQEQSFQIVALQEIDDPSWWSGNFSQSRFLSEKGGYGFAAQAKNVDGFGLHYGTAVISQFSLEQAYAHTFDLSWPILCKGFLLAEILLPTPWEKKIIVVSLHLDPLRTKTQKKQLKELEEKLSSLSDPVIVMGDFNAKWEEDSPVKNFANNLNLSAFQPKIEEITFPTFGHRIDWILVSSHFEFIQSKTFSLPILSDHYAVMAELKLKLR